VEDKILSWWKGWLVMIKMLLSYFPFQAVYFHLSLQDYMLRAQFGLPSIAAEESTPEKHPPIRVKFEIPYFTVSGIQVKVIF
jgi:hypothetical protein